MMKKLLLVVFVVFIVSIFYSCKQESVAYSFAGSMDQIDTYIVAGQMKQAAAMLKKLSKNASSVEEWLALYKRYMKIGRKDEAEKLIKKAYYNHSDLLELRAVYAHCLIQKNKLSEAEKIALPLEGTLYGSILTEIKFRIAGLEQDYFKPEFVTTFIDAAKVTHNGTFLRNAAVIEAHEGHIQEAYKLHPETVPFNDRKFWAAVAYDAGDFTQSYIDLSALEDSAEIMLLRADAALFLDEQKAAYTLWSNALIHDEKFSPVPLYNLCLYAKKNEMNRLWGENAIKLVTFFPEYVPGLVAYGDYAYFSNHPEQDDRLTEALRRTGLKTLKMEKDSDMEIVPVADAVSRMSSQLEKTDNPLLLVERAKLEWENSNRNNDEKLVDIWLLMEKYPENQALKEYAIWLLCMQNRFSEAEGIFLVNLNEKYGSVDYVELKDKMTPRECEYAAFFKTLSASELKESYETASVLYNHMFAAGNITVPSLMNSAAIYYANTDMLKAEELLLKASKLTADTNTKAEIQFRLANIYVAKKAEKDALMCLTYALSLNPGHAKARLLFKQLDAQ